MSVHAGADARLESLLEVDPELGAEIPEDEWELARRASRLHTVHVARGSFEALLAFGERPDVLGFFIAEGVLVRELAIDGRSIPELLGPGDVLEPPIDMQSVLPLKSTVSALTPTRVLVMHDGFARACGRWPQLLRRVDRRKALQRQRIAAQGAIGHLGRVELRLLALLWHLASTWGRVGADGVVVPFALTHEMLGQFVGAERPTVTLAIGELESMGLVHRTEDKAWRLEPGSEKYLLEALSGHDGVPSAVQRAQQVRRDAQTLRVGSAPEDAGG